MKSNYTRPSIILHDIIIEHTITATSIVGGGSGAYQVEVENWTEQVNDNSDINGNIYSL